MLLLAVTIVSTSLTIGELASRRRLRVDLAEISHVRYGLLNANRWVEKIVPVLSAKIDTFDLRNINPDALRKNIAAMLDKLIVHVNETMRANSAKSSGMMSGLSGQFRQMVTDVLLDVKELRRHVPEYTELVMAELGKPEARDALRQYLKGVLAENTANTRANVDMTR